MVTGVETTVSERPLEPNVLVQATMGMRGLSVDDDLILIDLLSDRSFRLNATGRQIWLLLEERRTVGDIAAALERDYRLDPQEAEEVATAYIAQLVDLGVAATEGSLTQREEEGR